MATLRARGAVESNESAATGLYRYVPGLSPSELLPLRHWIGLKTFTGVELDGIVSQREIRVFRSQIKVASMPINTGLFGLKIDPDAGMLEVTF